VGVDRALADLLLRSDAPPAVRAQRFVAGLAVLQNEAPGVSRGVVVSLPTRWSDDPATVEAVSLAARSLFANPYVAVVDPAKVLDLPFEARPGTKRTPLVRRVSDSLNPAAAPISASDLRKARGRLEAFGRLVAPDDTRVRRGERALLVSMSSAWT